MASKRTNERSTLHIGVRYDTSDAKRDIRGLIDNFELLQKESQIDVGLKNIEGVGGAIHEFKTLDSQLTDIADDSKLAGKQIDENISKAVNSAIDNISTLTGKTNDLLDLLRKIGRGEGSADDIKKLATDLQANLGLLGVKFDANEVLGMTDVQQQFEALSKGVVQFASTWGVSAQGVIESNLGISGSMTKVVSDAKEFNKALGGKELEKAQENLDLYTRRLKAFKQARKDYEEKKYYTTNQVGVGDEESYVKSVSSHLKQHLESIRKAYDVYKQARKEFDEATTEEDKEAKRKLKDQAYNYFLKEMPGFMKNLNKSRLIEEWKQDEAITLSDKLHEESTSLFKDASNFASEINEFFNKFEAVYSKRIENLENKINQTPIKAQPQIEVDTTPDPKVDKKVKQKIEQSVPNKVEAPVEVGAKINVEPKIKELEELLSKQSTTTNKKEKNSIRQEIIKTIAVLQEAGMEFEEIKKEISTPAQKRSFTAKLKEEVDALIESGRELPNIIVELEKLRAEASVKDTVSDAERLKGILNGFNLKSLKSDWKSVVEEVKKGTLDWEQGLKKIVQTELALNNVTSKTSEAKTEQEKEDLVKLRAALTSAQLQAKQEKKRADDLQEELNKSKQSTTISVPEQVKKQIKDSYHGVVYHGSKQALSNITYDPSKGKGMKNLGEGLYVTPDLERASKYGQNILQQDVNLDKVFVITEEFITDIDTLYKAMGKIKPDDASWESIKRDLKTAMDIAGSAKQFTANMQEMGYQGVYSKGYGYADPEVEQLVIYDENYYKGLSTKPYKEVKQALQQVAQAENNVGKAVEYREQQQKKANNTSGASGDVIPELEKIEKKENDIEAAAKARGKAQEKANKTDDAKTEQDGLIDSTTQDEIAALDRLSDKVQSVASVIKTTKTQAFIDEAAEVKKVVAQESKDLGVLIEKLHDVKKAASIELTVSNENPHMLTDPNGNLVTGYRGLKNSYGGLVSGRYHGGTFFTNKKALSEQYAGKDGKIEVVNLSMKNPFEFDAHGALWNKLLYTGHGENEVSLQIKELEKKIKLLEVARENSKKNGKSGQQFTDQIYELKKELNAIFDDKSNPYGWYDTNKMVEYAKSQGYDGVVFKNIIDSVTGSQEDISDIFVVFEQNQIHYLETLKNAADSIEASQDKIQMAKQDAETIMHTDGAIGSQDKTNVKNETQGAIDSTLSSTLVELQQALSAMIGSTDPTTQNTDADKGLSGIAKNVKAIYEHLIHEPEEKKSVQNDGVEDTTSDIDEKKLVGVLDELTQVIGKLQTWLNSNTNKDNSEEINEFNTKVITPLSQAIQELRDVIKVDDDKPNIDTPKVDTIPETKLTDIEDDKEKPTVNIEGLNSISEHVEKIHGILDKKEKFDEQLATSLKNAADGLKDATKYIEEDAKSRNDTNQKYMDAANRLSTAEGRKTVLDQALTGTDMKYNGAAVDYAPMSNGKVKVSTVVEDEVNKKLYDFVAVVDKVGQSVAPLVENGRRSQQVIEDRRKALEAQTVAEQKATQVSEEKLVNEKEVAPVSNGTMSLNVLDGVLKSTTKMYDDYSAANVGYVPDVLKDEYSDLLNLIKKIKEENRNLEKSEVESIEKTCKAIQNKIVLLGIESQNYDEKFSKMKDSTVDNGTSLLGDKDAVEIQKNFDEIEERTKNLQAKLKESDKSIFNREELKQEQKELDNLIAKTEKLITTAKANKSKGSLTKPQLNQFIKAESAYNESETNSKQLDLPQEGLASLDRYKQKYQELVALKEKFQSSSKNDITEDDIKAWNRLTQELKECREEYEVFEKVASSDGKIVFASDEAIQSTSALKDEMISLAKYMEQGEVGAPQWSDDFSKLTMTFKDANNQLKTVVVTYDDVYRTLTKSVSGVKQTQSAWEKFTTSVGNKMREMGAYFATFVSFYEVVAVVRQGITYVKEIDSALTELKKVTDETEESYNRFLQTASKTADKIGSTVAELTNATADFARLGYNVEDAAALAEAATIYKNVGDGIEDVSQASESIISTMQAFGYEAEDAMDIVNKFNEVGNNFAITSTGIGEALKRSASALFTANATLDDSIGLISGAI